MTASIFLKSWKGDELWPADNHIKILRRYQCSPVAIDLYWTIKDVPGGKQRHRIEPSQLYRRCGYDVCKSYVKMVEQDILPEVVAEFKRELEKHG